MFKILFVISLFLNSCVSLAGESHEFIDFSFAKDMPEFSLVDMKTGDHYDSEAHPNAAFVLEFYFNSCPACNQNSENVKALQREFASKPNVQILEVSIDCDSWAYEQWIRKHAPLGPVLNACDHELVDKLSVQRFPTTYVFAPSRRQAMQGIGVWSRSTYNRIRDYLKQTE